jgi:hypothetical protein
MIDQKILRENSERDQKNLKEKYHTPPKKFCLFSDIVYLQSKCGKMQHTSNRWQFVENFGMRRFFEKISPTQTFLIY